MGKREIERNSRRRRVRTTDTYSKKVEYKTRRWLSISFLFSFSLYLKWSISKPPEIQRPTKFFFHSISKRKFRMISKNKLFMCCVRCVWGGTYFRPMINEMSFSARTKITWQRRRQKWPWKWTATSLNSKEHWTRRDYFLMDWISNGN